MSIPPLNQQSPIKTPYTPHDSKKSYYKSLRNTEMRSGDKQSSFDYSRPKPFHSRITDNHSMMAGNKDELDEYIALVPCRWRETGWKYVRKDPKTDPFFSNPNRINFTGVNFKRDLNKTMMMPEIK